MRLSHQARRTFPALQIILLILAPLTPADARPRAMIGPDLERAVAHFNKIVRNQTTDSLPLIEIPDIETVPLSRRYPGARLVTPKNTRIDSLLVGPDIQLSVFIAGEDYLAAELWKVGFELIQDDWVPVAFESLLSTDIGDRFIPDKQAMFQFDELRMERDSMRIVVRDGYLIPARSPRGVGRVAILGKGEFSFTTPDPVERQQLTKFSKREGGVFENSFTQLGLIISPRGYRNLVKTNTLVPAENGRVFSDAKRLLERIEKDYELNVKPTETKWSFLSVDIDYLTAEFDMASSENWMVYAYDPNRNKQVSLTQKSGFPRNFKLRAPVTWCQFPISDGSQNRQVYSSKALTVHQYAVQAQLSDNDRILDLRTEVSLTAETESLKVVSLALDEKMDVQRVDYESGRMGLAIHQGSYLFVPLDRPLAKGESTTLVFHYSGKIGERAHSQPGFLEPLQNLAWIPMHSTVDGFNFSLEASSSARLQHVATASPVSNTVIDDRRNTVWKTESPVNVIGVLFTGHHRSDSPTIPEVELSVYSHKDLLPSASRRKEITNLLSRAMPFFRDTFGPLPYKKLDIVQMPDNYQSGQGLPSVVLLWGLYFRKDFVLDRALPMNKYFNVQRFFAGFLAHEIAHQWWGGVVRPKTYRDAWLSEGISSYAADLFVAHRSGSDAFTDMLTSHLEQAFPVDAQGAISLGPRLREYYQPIVYEKSAIVLHMLNVMAGDDQFIEMLWGLYERAQRGAVSTDDFIEIAEEVTGEDLDWFFDQWIYSVGYPELSVEYMATDLPNGLHRVEGRILQDQKRRLFRILVPVTIELVDGELLERLIWSSDRATTFYDDLSTPVKRVYIRRNSNVYAEIR